MTKLEKKNPDNGAYTLRAKHILEYQYFKS